MQIETVPIDSLVLDPANARLHPIKNLEGIKGSLAKFGQQKPLVVGEGGVVLAGNGSLEAARLLGWSEIQIVRSNLRGSDATAYGIADNATGLSSQWDDERLGALVASLRAEDYELDALGFDDDKLSAILSETDASSATPTAQTEEARTTLAQRFGVPPFSVLDARQGYWQERKNAWLALGLRSFEGREERLTYADSCKPPAFYDLKNELRAASGVEPSWDEVNAEAEKRGMLSAAVQGTSIFDPVLAELCYRWFCPKQGMVLDPFAGGSVRGLVAATLGRRYVGVDLRMEQCEANRAAFESFERALSGDVQWITGDSRVLGEISGVPEECDFVFSCPPYADLEQYSDDPLDLSNMEYDEFLNAYEAAIYQSVARLKNNRFACFVVGDVRDKAGLYRNFVSDTIAAFEAAGMPLYNEAILVTPVSSAAVRAGRVFEAGRKLCKVHQNVLVFVKGDWKKATAAVGACEWGELSSSDENALIGEE